MGAGIMPDALIVFSNEEDIDFENTKLVKKEKIHGKPWNEYSSNWCWNVFKELFKHILPEHWISEASV